jgi:hypothetical protein
MATLEVRGRHGTRATVLVDDADLPRLAAHRWAVQPTGYVARHVRALGHRRIIYLHREVVGATQGDRLRVEHANGDKLDHRRSNLVVRPVSGAAKTLPDPSRERVTRPPSLLDMLRKGGVLPTYWRRKRETAKWHRGMRIGTQVVMAQCERLAGADAGRVIYASIDEPWPAPHCGPCERATPGTDAVRDYVREGLDVNTSVRRRRARRRPGLTRTTNSNAGD